MAYQQDEKRKKGVIRRIISLPLSRQVCVKYSFFLTWLVLCSRVMLRLRSPPAGQYYWPLTPHIVEHGARGFHDRHRQRRAASFT